MSTTLGNRALTGVGLGLAVLLLATRPAQAATNVTTCGQTLSTPGEYILVRDLDCSGTFANGINIAATNVTLHLAGHTLSSTDCDLTKGISGIEIPGGWIGVLVRTTGSMAPRLGSSSQRSGRPAAS
jgi:hypothetical protein